MYPVTYAVDNPGDGRNRLTVFFRYIVAIPWLIVAAVYGIVAYFAAIGAWFAIVFTGKYPPGLYDFNAGFLRLITRINGFLDLATDEYPSFNGQEDPSYPVQVGVPPPLPEYDRLKTGLRLIFGIPVMLLGYVQGIIASFMALFGWFAILFTGAFPDGLFQPLRSALAYQSRAAAYFLLMTEDWPPFSLEEGQGSAAGQLPPTPPAAPAASEESGSTSQEPRG
jgi:hypothetical protein